MRLVIVMYLFKYFMGSFLADMIDSVTVGHLTAFAAKFLDFFFIKRVNAVMKTNRMMLPDLQAKSLTHQNSAHAINHILTIAQSRI